MKQEFIELANRIRELRDVCGYSLEEMAKEIGIDAETLKNYEEHGEDIPISVIYEIANVCKVDFTDVLTGTAGKLDSYHVVRRGKGKPVDRHSGYRFEDLAYRYGGKIMQPLLVTIEPSESEQPITLISHKGQEFNLVIEGTMILIFGNEEIILNQGDSVYFNAARPHGQKCVGSEKVQFLTVIAE